MVLKRSQSFVSLFDIRLKGADRDVVVLRGNTDEASSMLLQGVVVISALDPMSIKRVSLRCQGILRLKWSEQITTPRGPSNRPIRYEKVIFEHDWPNLELSSDNRTLRSAATVAGGGTHSALASLSSSTTNLAGMNRLSMSSSSHSSSSTNLHRSASSHALAQGNHELPFSVVIPGDIAESVEGLDGAQVVYKLTAVVERGRFSNNLHAKKHFRIVRTIGADSFEMSQTMSIENTWPNKVEYTITAPSRAVAIGSSINVDMLLIPLLKGLKLGNVKTQLVQQTTLTTPSYSQHTNEKLIHEQITPPPEDGLLGQDRWDIHENIPVPSSLAKCTQDVEIGSYIKVIHKLKFAIGLVNPDGHVSELRASLPLILFISPNVTISAFDPTQVIPPGVEPEVETLFDHADPTISNVLESGAPPNYEAHVYDRLWNEVPPQSALNSPSHSEDTSPLRSRRGSTENFGGLELGMTGLDPQQRSQLAAGLRALEQQQTHSASSSRSASGTTTPFTPQTTNNLHHHPTDYFTATASSSSANASPILSPQGSDLDVAALSRVPSYETAIKTTDIADEDLAPGYDDTTSLPSSPPSSNVPRFQHRRSLSSSAPGSSVNLNGMVAMTPLTGAGRDSVERQPSLRSSHQRNQSSSGLSGLMHRTSSSRSLFGLGKKHHHPN